MLSCSSFEFIESEYPSLLKKLPEHCGNAILQYAVGFDQEIVFNLDRCNVRGLDRGLFQFCPFERYSILCLHRRVSQITLLMATKEIVSNFSDWSSLRKWLDNPISKLCPRYDYYEGGPPVIPPVIRMEFNLPSHTPASWIRVDVVSFFRLTDGFSKRTIVRFAVTKQVGDFKHIEEHSMPLQQLRKDCFLLLSTILERHPERAIQDCPALWINAQGRVICASYPTFGMRDCETIDNPHASLSIKERHVLGKDYVYFLETKPGPQGGTTKLTYWYYNHEPNVDGSLLSMWRSICDLDWYPESPYY